MKPLPYNLPGPDNDLNELFHKYVDKAISLETNEIYAFGQRWGPENKRDPFSVSGLEMASTIYI